MQTPPGGDKPQHMSSSLCCKLQEITAPTVSSEKLRCRCATPPQFGCNSDILSSTGAVLTFLNIWVLCVQHDLHRLHIVFPSPAREHGWVIQDDDAVHAQLISGDKVFIGSFSYHTGVSNTFGVYQTPPFIIKRTSQSVNKEINCSHNISNYERILWYKQDEHKAFHYLGYLNLNFRYPEDNVKDRINFDGDGSKYSHLNISNVERTDSGVYFCAASQHGAAESPQVNAKTSWTPAASFPLNKVFEDLINS